MKLRLPHKLQAALAAALATVGFTLPQAQAANTVISNASQSAAVLVPGDITLDSITSTMVKSSGTDATPSQTNYRDSFRYTPANIGSGGGTATYTLNFTITGIAAGATAQGMTIDFFTLNGQGKPQNSENGYKATVALRMSGQQDPVYSDEHTILTYKGDNTYTGSAYEGNPAITPVSQASVSKLELQNVEWKDGTYTLTITFAQESQHKSGCFGGVGNIALLCSTISTWQGTEEQHQWVEANFSPEFVSGGDAIFGEAECKTVTVDEAVSAGQVAVNEDGYIFELNNTLTANSLAIEDGASLALSGASTLAVTGGVTLGNGAGLTIGNGSTVTLGTLTQGTGSSVAVNGSGTVVLTNAATAKSVLLSATGDGNITLSTVEVSIEGAANQTDAPTTRAEGTLTLDHSTLKVGKLDTSGAFADRYVNLSSFNQIKLDNSTLWVHAAPMTINGVTVENGTSYIHIQDKSAADTPYLTLAGTTTVAADSTLQFKGQWKGQTHIAELAGEGTLDLNGPGEYGKYTIAGGSIGKLQISSGVVTATITGDISLGGLTGTTGTVNANQNMTLTGSGDYSYTGNLSIGGQLVKSGTGNQKLGALGSGGTTVTGGTLELTSSITSTGALSLTGGTLKFAGANMLTAGSLSAVAGVTFDLNNIGTNKLGTIILATSTGAVTGDLSEVTVNWNLSSDYRYENLRVEDNKWVITLNSRGQNLTWAGGTGNWSYSPDDTPWLNAEQQAAAFSNKDSAVFKAADTPAVAILTQDITATNVVVENGANVTLQTSSGASLTATVLDIKGTLSTSVDVNATDVEITGAAATWNITDGAVTTDTITLTENASLTLSGAGTVTATGGISAPNMTVTLASDIVLQGSATDAFNLAGDGTYKLQSGSRSLGNVHLGDAEAWHGSVEISGNVGGGHTFQGLSNGNSFVKLNGVTTWLQPNSTIAANLILVGPDEETHEGTALNINAADSNSPYTFSGSIQGTGDIEFSQTGADQGRSAAFHLKGDLAGWAGNFVNKNGGTQNGNWRNPSLYLDGNGSVHMGGGIVQKAGQLDVYLGGNNSTDVTVDGDVTREDGTLNLTANKATTFNGAVDASNLTVNADTTVNKGLHVSGATTVAEGTTLNVSNVGDTVSLSVGDVTLSANSTMKVYEGNVFSETAEASLVIGDGHVLTAEVGATLYADLVMGVAEASPAVLDVSAMEGIGGLNMGSSVTLNPGNVALSNEDMALISGLEFKGMYDLFNGVDSFIVGSNHYDQIGMSDAWVNAKDVFTDLVLPSDKDYYLFYSGTNQGGVGGNVGTIYIMQMPEPTTGTLSLLALAALAARRRKH